MQMHGRRASSGGVEKREGEGEERRELGVQTKEHLAAQLKSLPTCVIVIAGRHRWRLLH